MSEWSTYVCLKYSTKSCPRGSWSHWIRPLFPCCGAERFYFFADKVAVPQQNRKDCLMLENRASCEYTVIKIFVSGICVSFSKGILLFQLIIPVSNWTCSKAQIFILLGPLLFLSFCQHFRKFTLQAQVTRWGGSSRPVDVALVL